MRVTSVWKLIVGVSCTLVVSGCFESDVSCFNKVIDNLNEEQKTVVDTAKGLAAHEGRQRYIDEAQRLIIEGKRFEKMMRINDYEGACNYMFDGYSIVKK